MKDEDLLQQLSARLPELEWKISYLGASLSTKTLPRGLFTPHLEMNAANCIAEIKADIQKLASQKNDNSAKYLAARIERKILVLVTLCHLQMNKPKPKIDEKVKFSGAVQSYKNFTTLDWSHSFSAKFSRRSMASALETEGISTGVLKGT